MMANAIGPQKIVAAIGIRPSTVETAVSMMGRKRDTLASITASQAGLPFAAFRFDLLDQDHGIAGDHADQREDAEDGHEAERPLKDQQSRDDAGHRHRHDDEHEEQAD